MMPPFDRERAAESCARDAGLKIDGTALNSAPDAPGFFSEEAYFFRRVSEFRGKLVQVSLPLGGKISGIIESTHSWGVALRTGKEPERDGAPRALVMFSGVAIEEIEAISPDPAEKLPPKVEKERSDCPVKNLASAGGHPPTKSIVSVDSL